MRTTRQFLAFALLAGSSAALPFVPATSALAAGFGSNNGLGKDGGPSFDTLRVPFNLSVLAVTQPFIGHEHLVHRMTWAQIKEVSTFVETVTKHHAVLAKNIDG